MLSLLCSDESQVSVEHFQATLYTFCANKMHFNQQFNSSVGSRFLHSANNSNLPSRQMANIFSKVGKHLLKVPFIIIHTLSAMQNGKRLHKHNMKREMKTSCKDKHDSEA
jgi:hypothetical protein